MTIDLSNPSQAFCFCLFMIVVMGWSCWFGTRTDHRLSFLQIIPPCILFLVFVVMAVTSLFQIVSIGFGHPVPQTVES